MTTDPGDLANLRDIVVPHPPAYWPPAPAWWVVAAALVAALAVLALRWVARYRRNAYRRVALRELDAIGPATTAEAAQRLSAVLKRVALAAYPRADVAGLTGAAWLAFLDRSGRTQAFSRGAGRDLTAMALGAGAPGDGAALLNEARTWVRRHRPDADGQPC